MGVQGWVYGVGTRVGYTGVLPSDHALLGERSSDSEAGPVEPCRGSEWVVTGARANRRLDGHPPPFGPGRSSPAGPPWGYPWNAASWPITARLRSLFYKVSQNGRVSPKSVDKAYHSPYSQNGLKKSPLEILGFPYSLAFSPKELMGLF